MKVEKQRGMSFIALWLPTKPKVGDVLQYKSRGKRVSGGIFVKLLANALMLLV